MFGFKEPKPDFGFPVESLWWFDEDKAKAIGKGWSSCRDRLPPKAGRDRLMGAYILRRVLLMIPTIFGIMAISFAVIQFAPGGPVEQVIAKLTGQGGDAGDRISRRRRRCRQRRRQLDSGGEVSSKYRGAQGLDPRIHRQAREAVRLRQAAARALRHDAVELCPLRFRRQLFPRHLGARPDPREDAGVDLARPVDHAAVLPDLDPARHPQGGQGRLDLRRLDQRRRHRRLRHPRLPVRASC